MTRDLITASRLKSARLCQRLHRYRYIDRVAPLHEPEALRFGTLMHGALEAWWSAPATDRLVAAVGWLSSQECDHYDRARALALMHGYDTRWSGERLEAIVVEGEFRARLINPETGAPSTRWDVGGKIDVIARDDDRRENVIVEHKTTSEEIEPGAPYWQRLRMDSQVSIYFDGAESLGYSVSRCVYDVIRKPALRPLKATPIESRKYTKDGHLYANQRAFDETVDEFFGRLIDDIAEQPARYFQRGDVVRLDTERAEATHDTWQIAGQIREAMRMERYPRNPDACERWGRTCEFFDVCTGSASLDDPTRFRRLPSAHPELSIVA